MGRIFHIATEADWQGALQAGRYTTSTLGRTLADEGFIHASRGDQWQQVRRHHYAGVTEPLVLLVIDTDLLEVPVIAESVPGSEESFPHVYGPLNLNAVVQAVPLAADGTGGTESFSSIFFREMFRNALLGSMLLGLSLLGVLLGRSGGSAWGAWLGLAAGAACGLVAIGVLNSRRRP